MNPNVPILSIILFLPLLGALVLLLLPSEKMQKWWTLGVTFLTFLASCLLIVWWQDGYAGMQFIERYAWVPQFNIQYLIGVDGLSLWLVLLTTFMTMLVIVFSWEGIEKNLKGYLFLILLLETGMLGVFVALDLVLFFVFWELSLVPMYFLIGVWGGPKRVYAAVKFFIFTMVASALMLVGILVLYQQGGTFDLLELQKMQLSPNLQVWLFLAFGLAFAVKIPLFPFHTWLPDAHVQAPTGGSVILAGILLKMGTYGFLRFCLTMFPDASRQFMPWIAALAVIGIIYGGLVALTQRDVKSLVAYSSVAHLGFVVLGLFALNSQGIAAASLQMVNHGLSTGALFLLVGMLYNRRHTRNLDEFGGLWTVMPVFGFLFMIVAFSSAGLPGLNGFVGEFNILLGSFQTSPVFAVIATTGIVVGAWYLLRAIREMLHGPLTKPENMALTDLNRREVLTLAPIIILIFLIGLFPNLFLNKINPSADAVAAELRDRPAITLVIDK